MSNDHEILADRLNAEPAIFKGCSSSELGMIVGLAIVIWLPLSLLLAWLLGAITMGFGIAGVGVVATVVTLATLFQRIKRGRPGCVVPKACDSAQSSADEYAATAGNSLQAGRV